MAQMDARAIGQASRALLEPNGQLAERVTSEYPDIVAAGNALEDQAMQLLALQSPVAGDLRLVMSIFPLASALTRMGGLARHVARLATQRGPQAAVDDDVMRVIIIRMGKTAQAMAVGLTTALATQDAGAARAVDQSDEIMDGLYRELLHRTQDPSWTHLAEAAIDAALLGRFFERFADQCVDAARRVVFVLTGTRTSADNGSSAL